MKYKKHIDSLDNKVILALADNAMNPTQAALQLYMHRNSLIYRVEKIERLTGLSALNFYDLVKLVEMAKGGSGDGK